MNVCKLICICLVFEFTTENYHFVSVRIATVCPLLPTGVAGRCHDQMCCLMLQLSQCQDRQVELERQIEDPNNTDRVRFIEGKDPGPVEIRAKIDEVGNKLECFFC